MSLTYEEVDNRASVGPISKSSKSLIMWSSVRRVSGRLGWIKFPDDDDSDDDDDNENDDYDSDDGVDDGGVKEGGGKGSGEGRLWFRWGW